MIVDEAGQNPAFSVRRFARNGALRRSRLPCAGKWQCRRIEMRSAAGNYFCVSLLDRPGLLHGRSEQSASKTSATATIVRRCGLRRWTGPWDSRFPSSGSKGLAKKSVAPASSASNRTDHFACDVNRTRRATKRPAETLRGGGQRKFALTSETKAPGKNGQSRHW